jgi:DNA repair exonuclease SbcCD nuclease subunit
MKTIRFIHTSDVHLDTSLSASGFPARLGDRKREAIRATFRRILEEARLHSVDLILIAGDLFEHDRVTPDTVEFLKQQFKGLGNIRVFIAPGNHDPFIQGSPYSEETWPENTHIFREEEFRAVEIPELGVRVAGFGFNRTHVPEHHFPKLQVMPPNRINLVVAHGSDLVRIPSGKSSHGPLTIDEIAGKNVRYCALGHYHEQRPVSNPIDGTEVWYCGIPEGRGWDEEGDCGYLFGEISDGRIQIESRTCNQYPLRTLEVNCDEFTSREQIVDAILLQGGKALNKRTILRVRLLGSVDPRLDLSTSELEARLADEVLQVFWEDRTEPAMDFESIATENTLRGRFARTMNDRIEKAAGGERAVLERARLYGLQALLRQEVRLR